MMSCFRPLLHSKAVTSDPQHNYSAVFKKTIEDELVQWAETEKIDGKVMTWNI